ncbi:MAG TPA: hypothetical protein PKU80_07350 [Candidatus Limiplasma sp.]|nr:hypothetical protein [Candidatus Limiplasma sp.]HRX07833.1 hypothetical protein [Candidatus Limiplasma sp.]
MLTVNRKHLRTEQRSIYENNLLLVREIMMDGTRKANSIGNETISQGKAAMGVFLQYCLIVANENYKGRPPGFLSPENMLE